MTARERPAAPPLVDAAVSRIERGVFAALDRDAAERVVLRAPGAHSRWRGRTVAVIASALAAAAILGVRQRVRAPGSPAHAARIATATSPSHLTLDGAAIDVAPSSAISFADERDGATVIRLERGTVTCEVAPRGERRPFVVEAGATRVTVVGTRFGVTRVGDHAEVWVAHGTVEVGDDGVTQAVHTGERYLPGAAGPAGTVTREETSETAVATAVSAPAIEAPRALAGEITGESPQRSSVSEHRHGSLAAKRVALVASASPRSVPSASSAARAPATASEAPPPPAAVRPSDAAPSAITGAVLRERFESAAALEVRDPLAAFRIYRELASGSGPWAANALFAEARLSAERGQRDAAYALLSAYLERFPNGANAADARALVDRLKGASGRLR